jgi:hypothetical protein
MAAVKVLNVAEKNDVAKNISEILSRGRYNRRDGASQYNKIYEYPYQVLPSWILTVPLCAPRHLQLSSAINGKCGTKEMGFKWLKQKVKSKF